MGKHFGRWWTRVSGFALHGCKTSEVPATWRRSTGECRVYFREAAEVLVRLTTNTRRRDWLHVCTLLARIGASISSIACGVDGDKGDTCRRNHRLSPHVPYFVPYCKVPCQDHAPHTLQVRTQVVGRMLPSRCRWRISLARLGASGALRNGGAKTAPLLERFPLGAATTVTPAWTGPWLRLDLGPARYRECWFHRCFCGHLS